MVDGLPHGLRLAFLARVDPAHRPLQLRELEDHVGGEIRLRQARGGRGMLGGIGPLEHALGNPSCELLDALRLVAIASELLVERQRVQALEPRLQGHLPVGVPEELRVPQPADDDALGVLRDDPLVARPRVHDREERFLQLAASRRRTGK